MSFLEKVLEPPTYGFTTPSGQLYVPTKAEIFKEFFSRLNPLTSKKHWLPFFGWLTSLSFAVPFFIFLFRYFSWPLVAIGFVYSMVILGSHGTFWLHRYCTHRGFRFRNAFWRTLARNLVIKIVPEEIYVVSHLVHHGYTEQPGDPYNVHCGWLYCFLADVNHQLIAQNLSEEEYAKLKTVLNHTGVRLNSYQQYQRWGTLCHPVFTALHYALNWTFWYAVFYFIGGHALATAIFGISVIWAMGVRTFNYDGHGRGKDKRRAGIDFNTADLSVNQVWPGYVAGEWHNNHHLYPNCARSGFLPYQLDLPWIFIQFLHKIGAVSWYRDGKEDFMQKYYIPYQMKLGAAANPSGKISIPISTPARKSEIPAPPVSL